MWLLASISSAILFAGVHLFDEFCVHKIFEKSYVGIFISGIVSLLVLPLIAFLVFNFESQFGNNTHVVAALMIGIIIQLNQFLYFQSLVHSEAGIVAAYWNIAPILVAFFSYIFLDTRLEIVQYFGIFLLVIAAVSFCLVDANKEKRWTSFSLILFATLFQAIVFLLFEYSLRGNGYLATLLLIHCGLAASGITTILFPQMFSLIRGSQKILISYSWIFLIVELFNALAYGMIELAILLGGSTLTSAVDSTTPGFTFLGAILLSKFKYHQHPFFTDRFTLIKIFCVGIMTLGVFLIST